MQINGSDKIPIERVDGPGKAWLELRGTILLYHKQTWVASSTTFIPVEWIQVSEGMRQDIQRLWRGLIALLVSVLFALPLCLLIFQMRPHLAYDVYIGAGLLVFMLFTAGTGLFLLITFIIPRRTVCLSVESAPYRQKIYFWRPASQDQIIQGILTSIEAARTRIDETDLPPIRVNHLFRRPLPYRMAFIKGMAVSFCLFMLMLSMEILRFSGYPLHVPGGIYAFLILPPAVLLLSVALRRSGALWEPRDFRKALKCYARKKLSETASYLESLLQQHPDHHLGRLLMVRTLTEQYAFDDALKHCEHLVREHPVLAARLQASIWDVKRMEYRMSE